MSEEDEKDIEEKAENEAIENRNVNVNLKEEETGDTFDVPENEDDPSDAGNDAEDISEE
jgi:hypothetical protein